MAPCLTTFPNRARLATILVLGLVSVPILADKGVADEPKPVRDHSPDRGPSHRITLKRPVTLVRALGSYGVWLGGLLRPLTTVRDLTRTPFVRWTSHRVPEVTLDAIRRGGPQRSRPAGATSEPLKVVVWNIERGLQFGKIVSHLQAELAADIYLLQEVDCFARRTGFKDVAVELAEALRMHVVFGTEFQELAQGGSGEPALHGQATLSRYPIREARVLRFSHQPKDWSADWLQPRHGGRMALVTIIDTPMGSLLSYNVHLESRGSDSGRARQMADIFDDLKRTSHRGPVLIAGDFNTSKGLGSPVFDPPRSNGASLIQFETPLSRRAERKQKDWVVGIGLPSATARLHTEIAASDHKPISLQLDLTSGREPE